MCKIACVILPTYNEAENVDFVITAIFDQAKKISTHQLHVLVVDDNSQDATQSIVRVLMAKYPNLHLMSGEKRGLGEAYKRGMDYAIKALKPDLIFSMDADKQHDPGYIPSFISLANRGFSVVIGSRYAPGGSTPRFSFRRRMLSLVANWMIRVVAGLPGIHDCTSGYRCIKVDLINQCDFSLLSTRGYSFMSSLLFELLRNGARVVEVPIIFPDRVAGQSKLGLRDQVEFLFNLGRIRFRNSGGFFHFQVVGVSAVLVNIGMYLLLTRYAGVTIEIASPVAIEMSILWNFVCNAKWMSGKDKVPIPIRRKIVIFHLAAGCSALANFSVFLLLVRGFAFHDIVACLVGIAAGIIVNSSINSRWTWRSQLCRNSPEPGIE